MRVGIAGLGLIGGSLALALQGRYEVVGWSPSPATRAAAGAAGVAIADSLDHVLPADLVIVASPIAELVPVLERLVLHSGRAVLLDVGSVKAPIAAFAERAPATARIVGGHPMAGTTGSGFAAADPGLFRDRPFLIVPTARSDDDAMTLVGDMARSLGSVATVIGAEVHDTVVAALSALPLAVAAVLAKVGADVAGTALGSLAGPGFRDTTRLASTPPPLGAAILADNSANVVAMLARFRTVLDDLERAVRSGSAGEVERVLRTLRG